MAKKAAKKAKREYRILRYFRDVRVELQKVVWPTRRTTINLTMIVLAVTLVMSISLGVVDLIFARLIGLIIG